MKPVLGMDRGDNLVDVQRRNSTMYGLLCLETKVPELFDAGFERFSFFISAAGLREELGMAIRHCNEL